MVRRFLSLSALATLAVAGPVAAQETAETLAARTALIEARTALEKAQADTAKQRLELLGLKNDATGKTELGEKGGQFEGWLLSSRAIDTAAGLLKGRLETVAPRATLILLAGDEKLDLALPAAMKSRLRYLAQQASSERNSAACSGAAPRPGASMVPLPAILAGAGTLLGSFRTDTAITGFDGPDAVRMVIAALADARGRPAPGAPAWIVPSDLLGIPDQAPLIKSWDELATARQELARCRATLATKGDAAKPQIDRIDVQLANIDDFASKQVGAGDGVSPLIRAAQIDGIAALKPKIVRLYVEKAGGSILNRRNLWTALGAPAVGITGGAVIGWRLGDPLSGSMIGGGNLVCRTELTSMRTVQSGRVRASSCAWVERAR